MEYRKRTNIFTTKERIHEIAKKFNVSADVAEILLLRGLNDDKEINAFLYPKVSDLHDPFSFTNMKKIVETIKHAIADKQHILIFGDYDVDGITSSYILYDYLSSIGASVDTFLPNRYSDGYGLTIDSVKFCLDKFKPDLIITVDCGISAYNEVEFIKASGVNIIITDHHECPETAPNCLILDAKVPNERYPFKELCGAGVAFKLVEALAGRDKVLKYLPVTAIATVSDIVPLFNENRALVSLGLNANISEYPLGIAMLAKELKLGTKLSSQDVSYKLAPKLNASGRMGDANHSLQLYIEKDKTKLNNLIKKLLSYNVERQDLCNLAYDDCICELKKVNLTDQKTIILANKGWSIGVLGIVCARLTEEFNRPTILFGEENGQLKGSGRSIQGLNIHEIITEMSDILVSFGGHSMAAGLSINSDKFDEFKTRFCKLIDDKYDESMFAPFCEYDLDINLKDISITRLQKLKILEPYGCQNPVPLFRFHFDKANVTTMKNYVKHINIALPNLNMLAFNFAENFNMISQNSMKDCIAELSVDCFRGVSSCKGIIQNIQLAAAPNVGEDRVGGEYIKQLEMGSKGKTPIYKTYYKHDLVELLNSGKSNIYGTLIVASSLQSYKAFMDKNFGNFKIIFYEYLNFSKNCGYNTLCLCPSLKNDFKNFARIIMLDGVLDESYVVNFNESTDAEIYLPNATSFMFRPFSKIDLSRKAFGEYFHIFKKTAKLGVVGFDDYNYFNKIKKYGTNLNYVQFVACLNTFKQLKLIEVNEEIGNFSLKMKSMSPTQLNQSNYYNKLELIMKSY